MSIQNTPPSAQVVFNQAMKGLTLAQAQPQPILQNDSLARALQAQTSLLGLTYNKTLNNKSQIQAATAQLDTLAEQVETLNTRLGQVLDRSL